MTKTDTILGEAIIDEGKNRIEIHPIGIDDIIFEAIYNPENITPNMALIEMIRQMIWGKIYNE